MRSPGAVAPVLGSSWFTGCSRANIRARVSNSATNAPGLVAVRRCPAARRTLPPEVIRASAEATFASAGHHEAVRRLWRETSADAHVLGCSLFQRSSFGSVDRRTGIGEGRAPGSLGHIAEAFLASYRTLKNGWSLFDRRCEQPTGA